LQALALVVGAVVIAAGAAAGIAALRDRADMARRGQAALLELQRDAYQTTALDWEATARGGIDRETAAALAGQRQTLLVDLRRPELGALGAHRIDEVDRLVEAYAAAFDTKLQHLRVGDIAAALLVDAQVVRPTFEQLITNLDRAVRDFGRRAAVINRRVEIGTAAIMLGAALLIALLAWLFRRERVQAEELRTEATTDGLTGLLNHRGFRELLDAEVSLALRSGYPLSVVLFDLDHFKLVNDTHGHDRGDDVLRGVAARLRSLVRAGEALGRPGGEEFAWVLPNTTDSEAWRAAERARIAIRETSIAGLNVTVSAGVCELRFAGDAPSLLRLADGALYWAKDHGRDVTFSYNPDVVTVLSASEKADRLERAQSLAALRALARVVDARDPDTQRHSERVADLAVRLAAHLGWKEDAQARLHEAALVHDIGKIGIPDALLRKTDRLRGEEFELVKAHAALGARIVSEVLTPDQTAWVRGHHERFDGRGYPDRLAGDGLSAGARILAVADSWDAMTTRRPYRDAFSVPQAMAELARGAGSQWAHDPVAAMIALVEAGEVGRDSDMLQLRRQVSQTVAK
jgi:diguanylate cyclase (GGDEF)-like protein